MNNRQCKYKIGGKLQGFIPVLFLLVLFGGISIWLYNSKNGAFIFCFILTILVFVCLLAIIYKFLFSKILIFKDGFYHQTRPGNGTYYRYNEIKSAWKSSGKSASGINNNFFNCEMFDGQIMQFPFLLYESDGIDYLIEQINNTDFKAYPENIPTSQKEYIIDGKAYGITNIIISAVISAAVIVLLVQLIPQTSKNLFSIFFIVIGILLPLSIFIRMIIRYFCFKVHIGETEFYFQSNPFNGQYYKYSDIKSCREELKVTRHNRMSGGDSHYYAYLFFFTDQNGKTMKFQFIKHINEREINILKERIEKANEII